MSLKLNKTENLMRITCQFLLKMTGKMAYGVVIAC